MLKEIGQMYPFPLYLTTFFAFLGTDIERVINCTVYLSPSIRTMTGLFFLFLVFFYLKSVFL